MLGKIRLFVATMIMITSVIVPFVVGAAITVTDVFDQPTSLVISESSNHKFSITIASAVDESDTLVLTFPSSFDTSSIIENDIDVADDGIDLTTAGDCSVDEQASVEMVLDVLTITICAGDGGAIAAGSLVEIEVGTNASASGSGSNRIENPAEIGTYYINLNGTFGDYGSIPVPIIDGIDGGEVSAVVSAPSSGGGGESGASDAITLSSPNGGEEVDASSTYAITWTSTGSNITLVELYYSIDGGSTYTSIIADEANDGTYSWVVPDVESTLASIRVEGSDSSSVIDSDESDAVFTITAGVEADSISVISPNGGESYEEEESTIITWSTTGTTITTVNLFYSIDGGSNYSTIIAGESNDGSYTWIVPSFETSLAVVRVVGTDGSSTVDTDDSDAVFFITATEDEIAVEEVIEEIVTEEDLIEDGSAEETVTEDPLTEDTTVALDDDVTTETLATEEIIDTSLADAQVPTPDRTIETIINVSDARLAISPSDDKFSLLAGSEVTANFSFSDSEAIDSVVVTYGDSTLIPLSTVSGEYSVSFLADTTEQVLTVIVTYSDDSEITTVYSVAITSGGMVYEVVDGERMPMIGAVVIIYSLDGTLQTQWDGTQYGIENPSTVGDSGMIGWYVPNGTYVVSIGKSGYKDVNALRMITNNILAPFIELEAVAEIVEEPLIVPDVVTPTNIAEEPSIEIPTYYESVIESPVIQATADLALPVATVAAALATTVLASSFGLLPFLQYIFSAPILFFARRRRQTFGVIYNSYTKIPIDLAIVRLYNEAGKIVRTMVTDLEGRYFFKIDPGVYTIKIVKNGFLFPSLYVSDVAEDGKYLDIYSGGQIVVEAQDAIIAANIPIDPAQQPEKHTATHLKWQRVLRLLQHFVAIFGVIASLFVAVIHPGYLSFGLFVLNLFVYFVTRILVKPKKRKGWGIVYDEKSQKAVPNAVVRLFEPKYNKLIESTLTDSQGRYAFMVGANEYYTTYEHGGFQKTEVRPIDFKNKVKPELVSIDVPLRGAV